MNDLSVVHSLYNSIHSFIIHPFLHPSISSLTLSFNGFPAPCKISTKSTNLLEPSLVSEVPASDQDEDIVGLMSPGTTLTSRWPLGGEALW